MNWEVFAIGHGDILRLVFNAIASIFGNSDYKAAMQTTAIIGFLAAFFKAAFDRDVLNNFRWFIGMIVFIMIVFVPKSTVIINDRITPDNTAVINNVPLGLAGTVGFFSFTGDWLTRAIETSMSMPNEVNYTTNGLLYANKLYEASRNFVLTDDRTKDNFNSFFSACVVVDGIGHNRFSWGDVMDSTDLVSFFQSNVAENAAYFKYIDGSGNQNLLPCRSGFSDQLKPDIEDLYDDIVTFGVQGDLINRFKTADTAKNKIDETILPVMSYLTGVGTTKQQFVIQQSLINAMSQGTHHLSQEVSANEFSNYLVSGAEVHQQLKYNAIGEIASEKIPMLKIIFETIIYAIFPIVVLMAILFPAKVSMAYIQVLLWINMWGPMYAVLHFIMSYYTQQSMSELATMYGNGFSVFANAEMSKINADIVATTGYLAASLPLISWMIISKSGAMAASVAGRVMQGYEQTIDKSAADVTKGEGQRFGNKWELTESGKVQNTNLMDSGSYVTTTGGGASILNQQGSNLMIDAKVSESTVQAKQQAFENATAAMQSERSQLSEANSAVLSDSRAVLNNIAQEHGATSQFKTAESAIYQNAKNDLMQAMQSYEQANNYTFTEDEKNSIFGRAEISAGAKFGISDSVSIGATASGGVAHERSSNSQFGEVSKAAENFLASRQFSEVVTSIGNATREVAGTFGIKENDSTTDQLSASLNEQHVSQREYQASVQNVETAKESLQTTQQLSAALSSDGSQVLYESVQLMIAQEHPGMNNSQVAAQADSLIRQAAGGSDMAMEQVKFAMEDADHRYGMGMSPGFNEVRQNLYSDGQSKVESNYTSGNNNVEGSGQNFQGDVDEQNAIRDDQADYAAQTAIENHQHGMESPSDILTNNPTFQTISSEMRTLKNDGDSQQVRVDEKIAPVDSEAKENVDHPVPYDTMWVSAKDR